MHTIHNQGGLRPCLDKIEALEWASDSDLLLCAMHKRSLVEVCLGLLGSNSMWSLACIWYLKYVPIRVRETISSGLAVVGTDVEYFAVNVFFVEAQACVSSERGVLIIDLHAHPRPTRAMVPDSAMVGDGGCP